MTESVRSVVGIRSTCRAHPRRKADCPNCVAASRRYQQEWRRLQAVTPKPSETRPEWVVVLEGDFGPHARTHALPVPDETVGRRRRDWWRAYRADVTTTLTVRQPGTTTWTEVTA